MRTHQLMSVGETVGHFTVLARVPQNGITRHRRFSVRCNPCGKVIEKNSNDVRKQQSCGCLHFHGDDRRMAMATIMYSHLKRRHRAFGGGDIIPLERFLRLSELPCRYCGSEPSNAARDETSDAVWLYSGLDRLNSQYGYIEGNVQPCCKRCNIAKSNMSEPDFLEHIFKIAEHMGTISVRGNQLT